jgi:hypothetical protein
MDSELVKRYRDEWESLRSKPLPKTADGDQPANPLLLDVPKDYFDAGRKVMIFGQETNGWEHVFPCEGGVDHLLEVYKCFYHIQGGYNSQFWNGFRQFKRGFEERLEPAGSKLQVMWNNVIKIGKADDRGKPPAPILDWQGRWFEVVRFEISHLQPTVVLFLSGPNYDDEIRRIYSDAQFEAINERRGVRHLARVKAHGLPYNSIRTYHPNYLFRIGFNEYLNEILNALEP